LPSSTPTLPRRLAGLGVAAGIVLAAAACSGSTTTGSPGSTQGGAAGGAAARSISLTFDDNGCQPSQFTAAPGDLSVTIKNTGSDTGEVEVVTSDNRVKGEAENVAPNFSKTFTANGLTAGTYSIVCGSDKAPKGRLTVVGDAPPASADTGTTAVPGLGDAVSQYEAYVQSQTLDLQTKTKAFVAAVRGGNLAQAQQLFGPTRVPYETVEPVAESFKDIDDAVDSRVDDHDGVDDPAWTGFHRIEYGLFETQSLDGLAPLADKLQSDVDSLVDKTKNLDLEPIDMVAGAKDLLEEVSSKKITGEEDRYSHTDLFDFKANLDGSQKVFELVKPLVAAKDQALADQIEKEFGDADQSLSAYANPDGTYKTYDALTDADRRTMSAQIAQLSEDLAKLPGVLGLPEPTPTSEGTGTTTGG
jgi:iron uptake system component EfeO